MGLIGCPETSVTNYLNTLHKIPEERKSPAFSNVLLQHNYALVFTIVGLFIVPSGLLCVA
jgi:hypothetical protein